MVFNDDGDSSGKGDVNDDDDDDEAHRCDPGGGEGCSEDEDGKRFQFCRQNKENLELVMMMIVGTKTPPSQMEVASWCYKWDRVGWDL